MAEIRINEQLKGKNNAIADEKTFPHLFTKYEGYYGENENEYYLSRKFWWEWDEDYNLIIESVLDTEELQAEIIKVLNKQKEFAEIIIAKEQKKLASIMQFKGVKNEK